MPSAAGLVYSGRGAETGSPGACDSPIPIISSPAVRISWTQLTQAGEASLPSGLRPVEAP